MVKTLRSPRHKRLDAALIDARLAAGLTQATLAKRLKRPQSFVAKYEGGERRLDVVEFVGIIEAVGEDPLQVFGGILSRAPKRKSKSLWNRLRSARAADPT